jgi:hypothetical protein
MVKSMVDADFSSADEQVVVTYDKYNRLLQYQINCEHIIDTRNIGGLDLAFGGDEIRLQVRNGNKHLGGESLVSKDVNIICDTIHRWFVKWNLQKSPVYADASGLGEPIISMLRGPLYNYKNIIPIKNNWTPNNANAYKNLGTEMWFALEKLIAEQEIILKDDDILRKQLCNRYYKINSDNTSQLESKQQAKAKGRPSPDRADALVLCFHRYKTPAVKKAQDTRFKSIQELAKSRLIGIPSIKKLILNNRDRHSAQEYMNKAGIKDARRGNRKLEIGDLRLEIKQTLQQIYGNN